MEPTKSMKAKKTKKRISLINEVIQYMEAELEGVKKSKIYPWFKGNGRDTAYYVLSNSIGHIKSLKASRERKN